MSDCEYFSSLYKPLHFKEIIWVSHRRVPVLINAPYRIDFDGSKEICNLNYWLFGTERTLRRLESEPVYHELMKIFTKKALSLIGTEALKL